MIEKKDESVGEGGGEVSTGSAGVIFEEPLRKIVDTLEVVPTAGARSVAGELNLTEQIFRSILVLLNCDHARHAKGLRKERPAIQTIEIHGRRLDVVIDFESEVFVGEAV